MADDEVQLDAAASLRERIKDEVGHAQVNGDVTDDVVSRLVKEELGKRAGLVVQALARLNELELEVKKIKPDAQFFDSDGNVVGTPAFSKEKSEALKKGREKVEKLTKAIEKALGKDADYEGLKKLLSEK